MSDNTIQAPTGQAVPGPSPASEPATPVTLTVNPPRTLRAPSRARNRGIPAAPAALAGVNTVAVASAGAMSVGGPAAGAATATAMLVGAAMLGTNRRRNVRSSNNRRAARDLARRSGMSASPHGSRSGKWSAGSGSGGTNRSGSAGSAAGRNGSGSGRSGSAGLLRSGSGSGYNRGSGSALGSGSGGSKSGSGSGVRKNGSGSGSAGSALGSGSGSGKRGSGPYGPGSAKNGPGRVGAGSSGKHGSVGSGVGKNKKGLGSGAGYGSGSAGLGLGSGKKNKKSGGKHKKNRAGSKPSLARRIIGPRPATGPRSQRGGLINRGDGSRRQPIRATKNAGRAVGHAAGGVGRGAKAVGRGAKKAYNSKAGKAARKWSVGGAKRAWGVGWPATAAVASGLRKALGKKGFKEALSAARKTWAAKRAKNAPNSKHGKAAAAAGATKKSGIPAGVINRPINSVGPAAPAPAGATTFGGTDMAQARFIEAAGEMLGAAMVYAPDGMMQVGNDFARMPEAFQNIAMAMQKMAQRAHDEDPIHPQILDMMQGMYQKLQEVASMAEDLGPAFHSLHAVDIQRINNPRRGEHRWDVSANRDYVGGVGGGGRSASSPNSYSNNRT